MAFDVELAIALYFQNLSAGEMAERLGVKAPVVRSRLKPHGLYFGRGVNRDAPAVNPVAAAKRADEQLASAAPKVVPAPVGGRDICALDAAILRDGHTWAGRAAIAEKHAVPLGVVTSRFHRLVRA